LQAAGIPTAGLRSKNWDEFSQSGAPKLDFVFTVCDNAAKEACLLFPAINDQRTGEDARASTIIRVHWGVPDPAAVKGSPEEIERAFREAYTILERRIGLFLSLPLASIDKLALKREVDRIGEQ